MFKRRACGSRETSKEISAIKELNCHGGRGVKEEGGAKNILKEKLKYALMNDDEQLDRALRKWKGVRITEGQRLSACARQKRILCFINLK